MRTCTPPEEIFRRRFLGHERHRARVEREEERRVAPRRVARVRGVGDDDRPREHAGEQLADDYSLHASLDRLVDREVA